MPTGREARELEWAKAHRRRDTAGGSGVGRAAVREMTRAAWAGFPRGRGMELIARAECARSADAAVAQTSADEVRAAPESALELS